MRSTIIFAALALFVLSPLYAYAAPGTIPVDSDGSNYDIGFDATGVEIITAEGDGELILLLEVSVTSSPATLEITFERAFFDSIFDGVDDPFFVIIDGFDEAVVDETSTDTARTLTFDIPDGTQEVEIIGSQILDATFGEITIEVMEETEEVPDPEGQETVMIEDEITVEVMEETEEEVMEETEEEVMEETEEEVMEETEESQCGTGTTLVDGECVATAQKPMPSSKNLLYGTIGGIGVAFAVALILGIVAYGHTRKHKTSN